jgi:hypothetical protein
MKLVFLGWLTQKAGDGIVPLFAAQMNVQETLGDYPHTLDGSPGFQFGHRRQPRTTVTGPFLVSELINCARELVHRTINSLIRRLSR